MGMVAFLLRFRGGSGEGGRRAAKQGAWGPGPPESGGDGRAGRVGARRPRDAGRGGAGMEPEDPGARPFRVVPAAGDGVGGASAPADPAGSAVGDVRAMVVLVAVLPGLYALRHWDLNPPGPWWGLRGLSVLEGRVLDQPARPAWGPRPRPARSGRVASAAVVRVAGGPGAGLEPRPLTPGDGLAQLRGRGPGGGARLWARKSLARSAGGSGGGGLDGLNRDLLVQMQQATPRRWAWPGPWRRCWRTCGTSTRPRGGPGPGCSRRPGPGSIAPGRGPVRAVGGAGGAAPPGDVFVAAAGRRTRSQARWWRLVLANPVSRPGPWRCSWAWRSRARGT